MDDTGHTERIERARSRDAVGRCRLTGTVLERQYRRVTNASGPQTGIDVRPTA
ncbi:hypothetical protein [Natrarchaeobaculum sulfurireducens]|nr:hypothetical protein [Natrarchaeobaculum sulfurireducens]AXR80063.1 hypothetical protein AArcMg_0029 [Natrarchaeobaculum sulfurireducens]